MRLALNALGCCGTRRRGCRGIVGVRQGIPGVEEEWVGAVGQDCVRCAGRNGGTADPACPDGGAVGK